MNNMMCPVCNGSLFRVRSIKCVFDGNHVYRCFKNEDHSFWHNPRDREDSLYLNPRASQTNFDFDKKFLKIDDKWQEVSE